MAAMFAGSLMAAVVSGTAYQIKGNTLPENWTSSNTWSGNSTTSYFLLNNAENYLQTEEFCQNGITSIVVNARKYGGPSADQLVISVEWIPTTGDAVLLGTVSPSSTSLANYTIDDLAAVTANTTGSIKLSCKAAASNKGSGLQVLTINYTAGSCGGDDPQPEPQMKTIYCKMEHDWWKADGAAVAAYAWTEGGATNGDFPGVRMTAVEGVDDTWKVDLDLALYEKVIFTRTSASGDVANWGAQTEDLVIPTNDDNLFTISTATGCWTGEYCKVEGAWSVYDDGGDDPEPPTPAVENGFYLVGTMNSWTPAAEYKFAPAEAEGEYILHTTLAENDEIKVRKVEAGQDDVWYPGGDAANYIVNAAHAGEKDIYFRPAGNEAWAEFGGFIWMGENTTPTADFTQPFTLKFNGTGDGNDRNGTYKVEDGVAALFVAASVPYVSALTTVTNVFAGRIIAEDNSSLKFGTSSKQGTLAFTLAQAIEVDSIIVNATQYGNNAAEVTINGMKFDLTAGNKVPQDCKITPEGEVTTISIAQSGSERIYLRNVRIYPKTQGGGDDPVVEPTLANGFYLIGQNGWDVAALSADLLFTANPDNEGEYKLTTTLAENDGVKVVKVENDAIVAWYPEGEGNEYTVDAAHAGENKDIYFQETYKEDWAAFGGHIWVGANETPGDDPVVEPTLADGFYLIGQNGWNVAALSADLLFAANPNNEGEYVLTTTLAENDGVKVVKVENDAIVAWYPDGEGNEYKVDAAHAGEKAIYFQETYKEDWAAFGGYIWIDSNGATAIDNTAIDAKAEKMLRNGMILIIKGDKTYNVMGQIVK